MNVKSRTVHDRHDGHEILLQQKNIVNFDTF